MLVINYPVRRYDLLARTLAASAVLMRVALFLPTYNIMSSTCVCYTTQ